MSTVSKERLTSDPVPAEQLRGDVARMMEVLGQGGVALVPLDVAYAILAMREAGIRKIFTAKQRSYEKPSGMFGNAALSGEIHLMEPAKHNIVRTLIKEERIPFSVVAPFRVDHPIFRSVDPFVLRSSSKTDTIDMLLNAGQFHDEIARQVMERGRPVFGSSANTSLTGSKYRLADIDEPVRAAADIAFDYGLSKYVNSEGCSSTIIDFRDFTVIRKGVCFEQLSHAFMARFKVTIRLVTGVTAGL
jgi:tRNA A37 threonylcarbamoyladenosine synthetase subunit TsaC/SUA5/YrdC